MAERRVAYVVSEPLVKVASLLPSNRGRSSLVHSLANALGFFRPNTLPNLRVIRPEPATPDDLKSFHDRDFIDFLLSWDGKDEEQETAEEYGLVDDCPHFPGMPQYVLQTAGAILTASSALRNGLAKVAIAWDGGRHHASKSRASGYCYVNDINLAILDLRKAQPRPRVMYLDLDLHFSDGVTEAFASASTKSPSILTLSIHHSAPGFFPASERSGLTPVDTSSPFSLSIPLREGASNSTYARIWKSCVEPVHAQFNPDFVVLQCGVDGLAGDPCGIWNLGIDCKSEGSIGWAVQQCLGWGKSTLLTGGGGYDFPNAARAWSYLTSVACGSPLSLETPIPEHTAFPMYAPSFVLDIPTGHRPDLNSETYLSEVENNFQVLISRIESLCNPKE